MLRFVFHASVLITMFTTVDPGPVNQAADPVRRHFVMDQMVDQHGPSEHL